MSNELNLARKIRNLKVGEGFTVATEAQRQAASRVGKSLKDAGVIEFDVVTKSNDGKGFKVAAI